MTTEIDRKPKRPRLYVLDGLRLVAALMVVCYHYIAMRSGWGESGLDVFPTIGGAVAYGWLGVYLFFLISGFVICMSCWGRDLRDFFVSRVIRLYPAFWFAVSATAAFRYAWPGANRPSHISDVLSNLTMFHEGMLVRSVDGVYWTLWVELRFYLIFAVFVVWRGVTYRRVVVFCVGWTALSAMAQAMHQNALTHLVMPRTSAFFVAGIAMFLMYRVGRTMLLWGIVGVSWLIAQHHLVGLHAGAERVLGRDMPWWPSLLIVTGFFAIMAAISCGRLSGVQWRWLTTAGLLTYPLYLIHEVIGWEIIRVLRDDVDPGVLVGVLIPGMMCVAWSMHHLIEKPLSGWLRTGLTKAMDDMPRASPGRFGGILPQPVPEEHRAAVPGPLAGDEVSPSQREHPQDSWPQQDVGAPRAPREPARIGTGVVPDGSAQPHASVPAGASVGVGDADGDRDEYGAVPSPTVAPAPAATVGWTTFEPSSPGEERYGQTGSS